MKPTEETPTSATPAPADPPNPGLRDTSRSPSDDVATNNIKASEAEVEVEVEVEMADGRILKERADQTVPAVLAEMNDTERPPRFDQSWFELADGTLRKVPWIHNNAMLVESINEYLELIKNENKEPFSRYEYDQATLLKFQQVVVSTAGLVAVMLGRRPNATDVEMIREALTQVRDRLSCW